MGVARLVKVTVISPRTDYPEVVRTLARFRDFHPLEHSAPNFDPQVQDLTVRSVRLFSQADQAVKDLGLKVEPGWMDQVFKGVKIERTDFKAAEWEELLSRVEAELEPMVQEVRNLKASLQKATKEETDSQTLMDALQLVSGFTANLEGLGSLHRTRAVICVVPRRVSAELQKSLPEAAFVSQSLNQEDDVVLVIVKSEDSVKLDRAVKALEVKPLVIPPNFPQNPSEAYRRLGEDLKAAEASKTESESALGRVAAASGTRLLAIRELAETARDMLDEARVSGEMKRMASISGFIPAKKEDAFRSAFGRWMVHSEPVDHEEEAPVLFQNRRGVSLWQLVTSEQGIPGKEEVDPTPLISFVFPVFFGLMFGDFGHGLVFTLFILFVRQRVTGTKRQWANIFLITGISSMIFGAIFGEFFGYSLYAALPVPPIAQWLNVDIVDRTGANPVPNIANFVQLMEISMVIGILHLTTGLGLDIYEGIRAGEKGPRLS